MMTMKFFDEIFIDLDEIIYGTDCSVVTSDR